MGIAHQQLLELGERARRAAASGAQTFPIPELAPVAVMIANDSRTAEARRAAEWLENGAGYHELLRLAADYVLALENQREVRAEVYVPKASSEFEPLLALWPNVLTLPTTAQFSSRDLILLRSLPVYPLGLVTVDTWADGRMCSPAEFFFHDLDHARFKIREDLGSIGVQIPDAYVDGTTLDPVNGGHRRILPEAAGKVGAVFWTQAMAKAEFAGQLLAAVDAMAGRLLGETVLLLFEVVHEKSFPLDRQILARELSGDAHTAKLRLKCERGFFGPHAPALGTLDRLEDARLWLLRALQ